VKLPKLNTLKDIVFREFLEKESEKEIKKVQILSIIANSFTNVNDDRIITMFRDYLSLELGAEIPRYTEHEASMMEFYMNVVKPMTPQIKTEGKGKNQKLVVTGLEPLLGKKNPKEKKEEFKKAKKEAK
jgi:hypothetical protein